MNITVIPSPIEEKPILERLLQLYLYDFTEFDEDDVDEAGLYSYKSLPLYWDEPNRRPFLIRVDGKLAGFVLLQLDISGLVDVPRQINYIAEFFVMKKYRKHGVGEFAARFIFDQFPGHWEIEQIAANLPAQAFWRKVIHRYTHGNYREEEFDNEQHRGPIQTFSNR